MKVLIIISQLQTGGAETVAYRFTQVSEQYGLEVKLAVLGGINIKQFPDLKAEDYYQCQYPNKVGKISGNLSRICFIRRTIKNYKPDIVLSFIDSTNVLAIIASMGLKLPVIISERNNPDCSKMSKIWFFLRRIAYPFASALVVANEGLKRHCENKRYNRTILVAPNLLNLEETAPINYQAPLIIAVGSLTEQKRFDVLIKAIAILKSKNKLNSYSLSIFGEGPLRQDLQNIIDKNGLAHSVFLRGQSNNIMNEYQKSSIFALSSDYEGQPNVLLEAMSVGLACIATDCDYGPGEIIKQDENGFLVPVNDPQQMACALDRLITSFELRESVGIKAKKMIHDYFSDDRVMEKWRNVFIGLVQK